MRMRRKRNQDIRIEKCHKIMNINPNLEKGKWTKFFRNENCIHIEIGCGKGAFITQMAELNPNINYIAIEKDESALLSAMEKVVDNNILNLCFISVDAARLTDIFEKNEISRIYLNFSDPWPQNKTAKRRLTHKNFLCVYNDILKSTGDLHFKTDNQGLFEFSLQEFSNNDWNLKNISLDLHNSNDLDNIKTEYEEKFSNLGFRIYRLEANKKE